MATKRFASGYACQGMVRNRMRKVKIAKAQIAGANNIIICVITYNFFDT